MVQEGPNDLSNPEHRSRMLANLRRSFNSPESKAEATSSPDRVSKFLLFKQQLHPKNGVVYYPCSSTDMSPSVAFPEGRVLYADIDPNAVDALKEKGCDAQATSAFEFNPGNVDVLIMLNPTISPDVPASYVVDKGFVLCNNYHQTATILHENDDYQLLGVLRKHKGNTFFDTEDLGDFWEKVETDGEFKNHPFYASATKLVEAVTGKKENVLEECKKLIEIERERDREEYARIVAGDPESAGILEDPEKKELFMIDYQGRAYALKIPKKKGYDTEDIYVFQKHVKSHQVDNKDH